MKSKILKGLVLSSIAALALPGYALAAEGMQDFVLDAVVVTASRIPTSITEAKADISVIAREEIETMHMTDVEEALRTVPGVQFLNYGGGNNMNANLSGIRINGSNDIVVLVDGVRVSDFQGASSSGYMYSSLLKNMDNIERIEVLRGSAATIYGSGAKGGVINIITRQIDESKSTIGMATGDFGKEDYNLNTQGRRGKLGYNVYFSKAIQGDTEDADGNTWEGETNTKNIGVKTVYDFDDQHKLTVSYDKNKSDYSGLDLIYDGPFKGHYEGENLTVKHDFNISDKWSNSFTYRNNDTKSFYGAPDEDPIAKDYTYNFISNQTTYVTSRHTVVFGLDYSKGKDNDLMKDPKGKLVNRTMENYSYYVQDDWKIIPRVTVSAGLRYDDPKSDDVKLETNTAKSYKLSYDITDNDSIYAGRSDFFILPGIEQLFSKKYGNDKLSPAKGTTSSVGYSKVFDDRNILTVNYFKTESDTTIGLDEAGNYTNFTNVVDRGWNAQFMTQIGEHWNANIGWAHLFHEMEGKEEGSGDNFQLGYYPKDLATFGIYYDYNKFKAGIDGFYFMRQDNARTGKNGAKGWPSDNYGVYNLSINYRPENNMNVYLKVNNLFDKLWAEQTNVIHGGKPGSWYAMPGRSFVIGMELDF